MKQTAKALVYLLALALSLVPVLLLVTLPLLLVTKARKLITHEEKNKKPTQQCKTVLVTGAPHTKGLQICRILKTAGHRVILADLSKFRFSAARFSNSVDKWVTLPDLEGSLDSVESYKESIKSIIREEAVDWWLPVSHTTTAITDTAVKTELEAEAALVKVLGPDTVQVTEMLDDKIAFLEEARALNLPVPDYYQISSCQDVIHLCRQNIFSGRHFFLKPLNPYSEDRVCFDRIPDNEAELPSFLEKYKNKISENSPYFVSEFVQGNEWTGNVIARDGRIHLYTSNPSSPMQIDYEDGSSKTEIFRWIEAFVAAKRLSGSLCFDFMEHPVTGQMLAIECNPRLHSNITLMDTRRQQAAEAIYRAMETGDMNNNADKQTIAMPDPSQKHIIWTYNELAKLLHGEGPASVMRTVLGARDAVWDSSDPLPFFLLPHLQIPAQLVARLAMGETAQPWTIVNYCLGQLR